jgi:hypothetical protein
MDTGRLADYTMVASKSSSSKRKMGKEPYLEVSQMEIDRQFATELAPIRVPFVPNALLFAFAEINLVNPFFSSCDRFTAAHHFFVHKHHFKTERTIMAFAYTGSSAKGTKAIQSNTVFVDLVTL